ncbi:hypothetical protein QYM36_019545 [Artemia franciscana]|uniref:Uncharacterized protein n=1 Tax=Artemia franciscana TaxID=6661 RepID=A0AA88KT95_ARTSF|nr:hypothetical protein QYM36_019545 [Artemia franciscana]
MVRNRVPKRPKVLQTAFGIPKSTLIDNVRRAKELREQEQGGIPVPIQAEALLRKQSNRGGRKKGASRVLTETPEKDKIEAAMMANKAKQDEKDAKAKARLLKKNMKKPTSQTKSKGQKRKQQTSLCDQSTDEESVVSVHLDDDTDDSLHIGDDELTEPLELGTLSIGDYVLVEFEGKNSSLHYVGFVKEKDNSEVFVSFLRRKDSDSSKFFFPQVVDESYVNLADVKMKLPHS